LQQAINSI